MRKHNSIGLFILFVISLNFMACSNPSDSSLSGGDFHLTDLQKYQTAGANLAAKTGTANYDCSNFSTQFYQNCYNLELPCRTRFGISGGAEFSDGVAHAWNSVKIGGVWVDWEPQLNAVYSGHKQTKTPMGPAWGNFVVEDISRIIYENIGRHVPSSIIDVYEIDTYWNNNSPFYVYFLPLAYCLSDDPDQSIQDVVSYFQEIMPNNNSGDIFIFDQKHLAFFFKYNNKYYGMDYLEESDPFEGRNVTKRNNLKEIIISSPEYTKSGLNLFYDAESGLRFKD